jgi:hypothetical protein
MPFQSEHGGDGQPFGGKDRPGAQCDHDGVALDDFTIYLHTRHCCAIFAAHDSGDLSMSQFGSLRLRRLHHRRGESFWMDLSRGCRRA